MIEILNKIYWFFSPFVSPEEKRIYKILHSKNPQVEIRSLMQSNIFKLCVYLEYFSKLSENSFISIITSVAGLRGRSKRLFYCS